MPQLGVRVVQLSEQHPREQGLKLKVSSDGRVNIPLSEQHPREQGLKHDIDLLDLDVLPSFQSNIQENKD